MRKTLVLAFAFLLLTPCAWAQFGNMDRQAFGSGAPVNTFHSTSSMAGTGSAYASMPMIDANGSATYASASPISGPRKDGASPTTPPGKPPVPVGDAILPLMLMAMVFLLWKRRKMLFKN